MIFYPNCKINLGLQIIQKRPDGYHDLETVFYPLSMPCDILEIVRSTDSKSTIKVTGPFFVENDENNICCKACEILQKAYSFPFLKINLHKKIPFGAGLGGGTSDAAMTLKAIRDEFKLPLDDQQLKYYAEQLGSDVPFFLYNRPMLAKGRGEILTPIELDLKGYYLTLIKPKTMVSTAK